MKLHVLTALTRPENLEAIANSLLAAKCDGVEVCWHIRKGQRDDPGGQRTKNSLLDEISDGWVWILDDDTVVHPDLFRRVLPQAEKSDAVVVGQIRPPDGWVMEGRIMVGGIDTGQVVFRRELAGDRRIPEEYAGDGLFFEQILTGNDRVTFIGDGLSYYNALAVDDAGTEQGPE
jgi:hypothetical protein